MKVLIVGLGSIAKKHIEALIDIDNDIEIIALRSSSDAATIKNVNNIYSLSALPKDLDFAIISNPTNLHAEYIQNLSAQGLPLFIEKPPLADLNDEEILQQQIIDSGILTYVACNLRFHPCIEYLNRYVSENPLIKINEVNVYCGSYLPDWRPGQNFREIYSANAEMGGGVHLDLFHELDYIHWIFGKPLSVKSIKSSSSTLNINAIDYANYILNYNQFTANIILNYFRKDSKRTIEVLFEHETWTVDLLKNSIVSSTGNLIFNNNKFVVKDTYKKQMEYFIDCLINNKLTMNTFTQSLEVLKTCLSNG